MVHFDKINTILISNDIIKYYLVEILKNDSNLNIIINKNDISGLIFKENKYYKKKKDEIIDIILCKIKKDITFFLNDFNRESIFCKEYLDNIKNKFHNHINEIESDWIMKKNKIDFITDIYQLKKKRIIQYYERIINNDFFL